MTLTSTSVPFGCGVGASLSCSGWPQVQTWNIRMFDLSPVMAGHSRSKNGVLSHAYVPAIPLRVPPNSPYRDRRDKPGDDSRSPPQRCAGIGFHVAIVNPLL